MLEERTSDVHTESLSPLLLGTGGGDVSSVASLGGWLIMEERTSDVHPISLSPLLLGTGGGDASSFADTQMSAAQVSVLFVHCLM